MTKKEILKVLYSVRLGWKQLRVGPLLIVVSLDKETRGWQVLRSRYDERDDSKE